jgi:hypothetical protein
VILQKRHLATDFGVGFAIQILDVRKYACGLKREPALNANASCHFRENTR